MDRIKYLVVIGELLNAINNNRECDIVTSAENITNIVNDGYGRMGDDERDMIEELVEEIDTFLDDEDLDVKEGLS